MSDSTHSQLEEKGFVKVKGLAIVGDVAVSETESRLLTPTLCTQQSVDIFNNESEGGWQLYRKSTNEQTFEVYGSGWPVGSVIEMFGEKLRILENNGERGHVETLDGEFISNRFYWKYHGDFATLIKEGKQSGGARE